MSRWCSKFNTDQLTNACSRTHHCSLYSKQCAADAGALALNTIMLDTLEAFGKVVEGGFGLRYVFSPSYRVQVHKRWATETKFAVFIEVSETVIGLIFLFIVIYVVYSLAFKSD